MSAKTLPGTIPGLLRRGVSVISPEGYTAMVVDPAALFAHFDSTGEEAPFSRDQIALDLSDKTSRWHAAQWLKRRNAGDFIMSTVARDAYTLALGGDPMTDTEIGVLISLVMAWAEDESGGEF